MQTLQDLLYFVEQKIESDTFIGLNTSESGNGKTLYTVDYWEAEVITDNAGEQVQIKAGKQVDFIK